MFKLSRGDEAMVMTRMTEMPSMVCFHMPHWPLSLDKELLIETAINPPPDNVLHASYTFVVSGIIM